MCKQVETPQQLAHLVSPACSKHSVSGKPGRMVNQAVNRMTNAKNHQQKETDHPAKTPPQCQHERTFMFYPELVTWQNNGKEMGPLTHGAKITGCMNCGKTIASNYAE